MSSGWKQTGASEGGDAMVFFGNLFSFFKNRGSKTSNFISLNPVSDSFKPVTVFFKAGVHVVNYV